MPWPCSPGRFLVTPAVLLPSPSQHRSPRAPGYVGMPRLQKPTLRTLGGHARPRCCSHTVGLKKCCAPEHLLNVNFFGFYKILCSGTEVNTGAEQSALTRLSALRALSGGAPGRAASGPPCSPRLGARGGFVTFVLVGVASLAVFAALGAPASRVGLSRGAVCARGGGGAGGTTRRGAAGSAPSPLPRHSRRRTTWRGGRRWRAS